MMYDYPGYWKSEWLPYKENVDDYRESPTLQLIECQEQHLAEPLKVYDPYIHENLVKNQYHDFHRFLDDIDFLVIMVGHNEIIQNMDLIEHKVVLDTRNVCTFEGAYKL